MTAILLILGALILIWIYKKKFPRTEAEITMRIRYNKLMNEINMAPSPAELSHCETRVEDFREEFEKTCSNAYVYTSRLYEEITSREIMLKRYSVKRQRVLN